VRNLAKLVKEEAIAKFQVNPRTVIVYLRAFGTATPLRLTYKLKATMPVKVTVPPSASVRVLRPG